MVAFLKVMRMDWEEVFCRPVLLFSGSSSAETMQVILNMSLSILVRVN